MLRDLVFHLDDEENGGPGSTAKKIARLPPDSPEAYPDVVGKLVAYLIKPEAYFMTGQTVTIDGGVFFD